MDFPASELIGYLEGRPVLPVVRRILNILLSFSLASFIFQQFYFKYQWLDLINYKAELDFFIKGYFFVPFFIFVIIHHVLAFFSWAIFSFLTTRKSKRILAELNHAGLKPSDYQKILRYINKLSFIWGKRVKEKQMYVWVQQEFGNLPPDQWQRILADMEKLKPVIRLNFQLALKAIITISLYFFSISYFGIVLYVLALLLLLAAMPALYFVYVLLEIWPPMVQSAKVNAATFLNQVATAPTI